MAASNCTSGCRTQDHESYGECLRSNSPSIRVTAASSEYSHRRKWDTEIREYRAARSQGIQPKSTQLRDIRSAVSKSQRLDRAVKET